MPEVAYPQRWHTQRIFPQQVMFVYKSQSISLVLEPAVSQLSCIFARYLGISVCIFLCVSCLAGSRSGSPGRVLTTTALSTVSSGAQRILVNSASAQKRSKIPRSQGCSREASPSRLSVGKSLQGHLWHPGSSRRTNVCLGC